MSIETLDKIVDKIRSAVWWACVGISMMFIYGALIGSIWILITAEPAP